MTTRRLAECLLNRVNAERCKTVGYALDGCYCLYRDLTGYQIQQYQGSDGAIRTVSPMLNLNEAVTFLQGMLTSQFGGN